EFDINRLMELMPPHEGAGESGDWAAVEQAWGFRFPRDYTEFITWYGQGSIEACVSVLAPDELMPPDAPQPGMRGMTEEARWLFEEDGEPTDEVRSAEQIIVWGGSCTADTLGWLTIGDDSDAWPVLILGRQRRCALGLRHAHGRVPLQAALRRDQPEPRRRRRDLGRAAAPLRSLAGRVAADPGSDRLFIRQVELNHAWLMAS
ncbi:SMI1/KNR4 family protein, partial [Kitasatospora sp. NPDC058263]